MTAKKRNYTFTWHIINFSFFPLSNTESIFSPNFKAENLGGNEYYLQLYPRGKDENKLILCDLKFHDGTDTSIDSILEMINHNGDILISVKKEEKNNERKSKNISKVDVLSENLGNQVEDILTIRCQIMSQSKIICQPAIENIAMTKIGVDKCSFLWNIEIPSSFDFEHVKEVYFNENSALDLIFNCIDEDFIIKIRRNDEAKKPKFVTCIMTLIDQREVEIVSKSSKHLFLENSNQEVWEFPIFLSGEDFLKQKYDLKHKNILTLKCEIAASSGEMLTEIISIKYEDSPCILIPTMDESFSTLQEDLRHILETQKNADVKLRVENCLVPAHKVILSARSPVFNAMFDQNMAENQSGIVDIVDLDGRTLNDLLEFIYTGRVNEPDIDNTLKLLVAADKYLISTLAEKCVIRLKSMLSVESVCNVYAVGDMVCHENLKSSAQKFIERNSAEVLASNVWSDWMKVNLTLANEILFKLAFDAAQRKIRY